MLVLGLESTAHTFSIGIVNDQKILSSVKDMYIPKTGAGIHPSEAAQHHLDVKNELLEKALKDASVSLDDIDLFAFSQGPGLPPCLRVGTDFIRELSNNSKPVIGVNHCIAHIEIGRFLSSCNDPVIVYVSGGNTQIIAFTEGKYRVFGETLDIAIGNARDMVIRSMNLGYPGGPIMDKLAMNGKYIEMPYVVKGMDLSFSGIVTDAIRKFKLGASKEDICYSFSETTFSMLTEVSERAMAHTGKKQLLLTGGVAASPRLREMLDIMCKERNAEFHVCPKEFAGDNGAMISYTGWLSYKNGQKPLDKIDFIQKWRTDEVDVSWRK